MGLLDLFKKTDTKVTQNDEIIEKIIKQLKDINTKPTRYMTWEGTKVYPKENLPDLKELFEPTEQYPIKFIDANWNKSRPFNGNCFGRVPLGGFTINENSVKIIPDLSFKVLSGGIKEETGPSFCQHSTSSNTGIFKFPPIYMFDTSGNIVENTTVEKAKPLHKVGGKRKTKKFCKKVRYSHRKKYKKYV